MKLHITASAMAILFLFSACANDEQRQTEFVGTYEVTLDSPKAEQELRQAKKDMNRDIEEAREQIRQDMAEARQDIEQEFGEKSGLGQALGNFAENMGELAANLTQLGESLGNLGMGLGSGLLTDVRFNATFELDGTIELGRKQGIRITSDDLRWKIKDGDMYLWEQSEGEAKAQRFEIKKISEKEWDLVGDEVVFHLRKN